MKRDNLETYLGKYVKLKLFDDTVIEGVLYRTEDKKYKNDINFYMCPKRYVVENINEPYNKSLFFRCSHVKKIFNEKKLLTFVPLHGR